MSNEKTNSSKPRTSKAFVPVAAICLVVAVLAAGLARLSADSGRVRVVDSTEPGIAKEIIVETNIPEEDGLKIFGEVGEFAMTERSGMEVSKEDLEGQIWVADFIFTRCGGPCPTMSQGLQRLQERLPETDKVKLVSFTVDPDFDTPTVLSNYANKYEADPDTWWFLRGTYEATQELAVKSLYVGLDREGAYVDEGGEVVEVKADAVKEKNADPHAGHSMPMQQGDHSAHAQHASQSESAQPEVKKTRFVATTILHSTKYVLIDQQGRVRGYYEGVSEDATEELLRDIEILLKRS